MSDSDIDNEIHWYTEEMRTNLIVVEKLRNYLVDLGFSLEEATSAIDNQIELGWLLEVSYTGQQEAKLCNGY